MLGLLVWFLHTNNQTVGELYSEILRKYKYQGNAIFLRINNCLSKSKILGGIRISRTHTHVMSLFFPNHLFCWITCLVHCSFVNLI